MNFEQDVIQASQTQPVIVDFFAEWCGPCKMYYPIIQATAADLNAKVVKVDIDKEQDLMKSHNVASIPTVVVYYKGVNAGFMIGFKPKPVLSDFIKKIKDNNDK